MGIIYPAAAETIFVSNVKLNFCCELYIYLGMRVQKNIAVKSTIIFFIRPTLENYSHFACLIFSKTHFNRCVDWQTEKSD